MNNNYIDYVNVLRDLRKYCGMQKVQYDKLLKDVMGEFPNENKRYLTELYNDLDVFGMLNKRSKIANEEGGFFGEQQKISLEKSRKLYKASLKDLLNNWKDTSEFKHNSFMNEFSDLMLNNYLN